MRQWNKQRWCNEALRQEEDLDLAAMSSHHGNFVALIGLIP